MTKRRGDGVPADERIASLGVLGPIGAWDRLGRPVRVTRGQQRVLALLLESANGTVRDDVLQDKLWPGEESKGATGNLQTHIWSLKNLFGREEDETVTPSLRRRDSGYELRVDGLQFDWFRFQRLRAAAARAVASGRPAEAKRHLLDARRLWRGDALLGLAGELYAIPFVQHLEAARADVDLQLMDVGLALGEHHELIPPLRHLTARHPQDESLARLLMLALFRAGRQAQALEAYYTCRRALTESGLVATPQLSATEVDILTHAPAAMPPVAVPRRVVASALSGTLLLGKWPPATPPPSGLGDSELALIAADEGGDVLQFDGSSVLARFDDVDQAIAAAVATQRWLERRQTPLARFVLHDGSRAATRGVRLLDLCERLLSEAHAGQILVFRSAEDPHERRSADGIELRELGEHQVHGSDPAIRLFQLVTPQFVDADRPFTLLAPTPLHNLPTFSNRFIGREELVEEVALTLSRHRMVTLTGPGGGGKTRVAAEAARSLLGEYRDGRWFVELEWLTDGALIAGTVADVMGIERSRNLPMADVLARELADRQVLIVLDTCEHLLGAVRSFLDRLLASCPRVSVVTTSLQQLGCEQEQVVPVPPLDSAPDGPAVALFCDYLGAAPLTEDDLCVVAEICELVDGIPLAIALAAARARQLGLSELAGELRRSFGGGAAIRLLDAGGRLRHTLQWSYSLLDDADQRALREMSLLAGAFGLDEARQLLTGASEGEVAASLCSLASFSAVVVLGDGTGPQRYRLLQPVRAFAASKLDEDPSEQDRLRRTHAELYLRKAEAADAAFGRSDEHGHLAELDACLENLRAAAAWAIGAEQGLLALGLAASLWRYWFSRGHLAEGLKLCLDALALDGDVTPLGMRALGGSSYLAWWTGDLLYTRKSAEAQASRAEEIDDAWARAWAPLGLAAVSMFSSEDASPGADLRPAVAYFIEHDLPWEAGQALQLLAGQAWYSGDYHAACAHYGRAVEVSRAAGSQSFMDSLQGHGLMLGLQGRVEDGVREIQAGLELADRRRDPVGVCHALTYRATIATYEGDSDEAARLYALALRVAADTGEIWIVQWALDGLGAWAATRRSEVAARLLGRVDGLVDATGIRLAPKERAAHVAAVRRVEDALGAGACRRGLLEGRTMGVPAAVELALGLAP